MDIRGARRIYRVIAFQCASITVLSEDPPIQHPALEVETYVIGIVPRRQRKKRRAKLENLRRGDTS